MKKSKGGISIRAPSHRRVRTWEGDSGERGGRLLWKEVVLYACCVGSVLGYVASPARPGPGARADSLRATDGWVGTAGRAASPSQVPQQRRRRMEIRQPKKEEADEMSKCISQLQLNEWECNQGGAQYAAIRPLGGRRTQSDSG